MRKKQNFKESLEEKGVDKYERLREGSKAHSRDRIMRFLKNAQLLKGATGNLVVDKKETDINYEDLVHDLTSDNRKRENILSDAEVNRALQHLRNQNLPASFIRNKQLAARYKNLARNGPRAAPRLRLQQQRQQGRALGFQRPAGPAGAAGPARPRPTPPPCQARTAPPPILRHATPGAVYHVTPRTSRGATAGTSGTYTPSQFSPLQTRAQRASRLAQLQDKYSDNRYREILERQRNTRSAFGSSYDTRKYRTTLFRNK